MPLAKPTKPDAITAVPTPVPLRTDRANFAARGDAMMGWFPTGIAGVNTTLTYFGNAVNFVEQEANEAEASATAAAASNVAAAGNAAAAAASAGATVWVTGSTYTAGVVRYSPTNFSTYRDTVGGLSSTDPASDTTGRWQSAMLPSAEAIGLPNVAPTIIVNGLLGRSNVPMIVTRASTKGRFNKLGLWVYDAAGVLGVSYDPKTKEPLGYHIAPATTYLSMQSEAVDTQWAASNVTVTPAAALGLDGTLSAFKIEATATAVTAIVRALTATATTYYFTVRAKKGSGATDFNIFGAYNITTGSDINFCSINYDTGAITQSFGSGATAREVANGYWEIKIPITVAIGNSFQVYLCTSSGVETAGKFAYITQPQVSDKPNAPYHPTAGSSVPRPADVLTITGPALTDNFNNAEGTLAICVSDIAAADYVSVFTGAVGGGNYLDLPASTYGSIASFRYGSSGVIDLSAVIAVASKMVYVCSYDRGVGHYMAMNEQYVTAAVSGPPANATGLTLGSGGFPAINGYLEWFAYYPSKLTVSERKAIVNNA